MAIETRGMAPLLFVFDMPTSVHFYRDVLGFEIAGTSQPEKPGDDFGWCRLRFGGGELMLNTAYDDDERPPVPDPVRIVSHSDTTLYFACEDLDSAYRHLRELGIEASQPQVAYYGMKQLSFKDPDGFGICLQWPATQNTHDQWVEAYGIQPKEIG